MTKPRVLFAIPELDSGGPDRVFFEVMSGLDKSAFDVFLIVSSMQGRYLKELPAAIRVVEVSDKRYPIMDFAKKIDEIQPDVVITTLRMNFTAAIASLIQRSKPTLIARQANAISINFEELRKQSLIKHRIAEWLTKLAFKIPATLIAQSQDMAKELKHHVSASTSICVIGNPVCPEQIKAKLVTQKTAAGNSLRKGQITLVAVGRLAHQKGFDLLIPAFAEFLKEKPGAILNIYGEGEDRLALEQLSRSLGVEDFVYLPGHTDNVLAYVEAADIFVSSSRYEGFSNAILEAMAIGTLVVATNCEGATKDLVTDGETGILVEHPSVSAIAAGLLAASNCDAGPIQERARMHVSANFNTQKVVSQYEALIAANC